LIVAAVLALFAAVPAVAVIAPDLTVPAAGTIVLPDRDLAYVTELTIINHRDADQLIAVHWIDGQNAVTEMLTLKRKAALFHPGSQAMHHFGVPGRLGALRFEAVKADNTPDPEGRLEVRAFVIAERGRFGAAGKTRQEIETIPSSDYLAPEALFAGVIHNLPTYTNVGVVNLDPVRTITFYISTYNFQSIEVEVAPMSTGQVRLPGKGENGLIYLSVKPDWALVPGSAPAAPWVAYTSTIDGVTGDAASGVRVPIDTQLTFY